MWRRGMLCGACCVDSLSELYRYMALSRCRQYAIRNTQYFPSILMLLTAFAVAVSYSVWNAPVTLAHGGGTPQLVNGEAGPYRIFVWTQPEPLHAGDIHVTIAVILADPNGTVEDANAALNQLDRAVTDANVQVSFGMPQQAQNIAEPAQLNERTGIPYYEADVTLPAAGHWQSRIAVNGIQGQGEVSFNLSVLPPREINWPLVVGGAAAVIVLLGLAIAWSRVQSGRSESAAVGVQGYKLASLLYL